jgi:hypothetical protein
MAQPTNTFSSYDAKGNREDLTDVIHDISPTDTPFLSGVEWNTAEATLHEWQTDALASASATNAVIEGDDATNDASTATVRLGNYTQISDKVAVVTGTQQTVRKAGRKDEMAYQVAKRARELKRDMESSLLANNAKVAGNDSTARELAGVPAWIATNVSKAGDGSNPTGDGTDARSDGTQRDLTEAMLKTVLQACWDEGGDPDCLMVGGFNKQRVSEFTGNATRFDKSEDKKLTAAVDVYESDFGQIKVIPNRFQRARDALVLEKDRWKLSMLRPFELIDLARTGDTTKKQLIVEYTLEACNEKASGIIADLTTS